MTRREKFLWVALGALAIAALAVAAAFVLVGLVISNVVEAASPAQADQTRSVDWYYWLDTSARKIQRSRLDGSLQAEDVVTSAEMSAPRDFALDPGGDYVYWTDDGYNQIRRKAADGTGSFETLVSSGLSQPWWIAVDGSHVYWADTGNDTIKRVPLTGGNVTQLAGGNVNPLSNVSAIAVHGSRLYWADNGNDSVRRVSVSGSTAAILVSSGLTAPHDIEVDPDGDYVYVLDRNGTSSTVKRVANVVNGAVTTLASNTTATPVDDPVALTLDPEGDYVYWLDEDDQAVRRVATDGAGGSFETLTATTGSSPKDLIISPGGGSVYWSASVNAQWIKWLGIDGDAVPRNVITSGVSVAPVRLRVHRTSETVTGSCITDAGALASDYASHDWTANIEASCPSAFYTFRLADTADLRVTATSSAINPAPLLRKGGLDGEPMAITTVSSGSAVPYVYTAAAGEYAIEVVPDRASANAGGGFSGQLQTQPGLSGCDVNLGTLGSDPISAFGSYDVECGDTKKFFVYLEFQASISASASGVGFTPRIELRPGSASDAATPDATDTGNPADIYRQVTSGSYRLNLEQITADDTYNVTFQAFGLPPPTRTPIPTPTPRFQANLDVRLEPNPRAVDYEENMAYQFRLEGAENSFPALARITNDADFALTASSGLDCSAGDEVDELDQLDAVYLHVCSAPASTAIEVVRESDFTLLASYLVQVSGGAVAAPTGVGGPTANDADYTDRGIDRIGFGEFVDVVCDAAGANCDTHMVTDGVGALLAGLMFLGPTAVSRGRVSAYSSGIGITLSIIGLFLWHHLAGMPLWYAAIPVVACLLLTGAMLYLKFRRVGS